MARREFLMLGKVYDQSKHKIGGYYLSEKLDGGRCFWDGGLTRGIPTTSVPWAGVLDPKTGQPKKKIKPIATGLWSRYGNPIMAPDWWLGQLPCCPLDGELWAGRGNFQKTMSAIRKDTPVDEEWANIQFGIFSSPNIWAVMQDGEIKNSQFIKTMEEHHIKRWIHNRDPGVLEDYCFLEGSPSFSAELANLNAWIDTASDTHFLIRQTKLPDDHNIAASYVEAKKKEVIESGGEGLVLRCPHATWTPKRVPTLLKVKGELDDEGTVVGFVSGRKTNKGSKLLGLIGAIVLDFNGKRLELSGFTDEEREFATPGDSAYAVKYPGQEMPIGTQGLHFKVGDKITFKYRELTNEGLPKEARYLRKR
jgi:DNA ligase-1